MTTGPLPLVPAIAPWIAIPYAMFVAVLIPVYWDAYGPGNFLWFSDLALFGLLLSLWTGWRLPYSMVAVGVLPLEILWLADFVTGGNLIGLAAYMFDGDQPLHLRLLSSFHLFLPPITIWLLASRGYDRRAFRVQLAFGVLVLVASWLLTAPEDNINWVHGFGDGEDRVTWAPPLVHLGVYVALLPLGYWIVHRILRRLFRA